MASLSASAAVAVRNAARSIAQTDVGWTDGAPAAVAVAGGSPGSDTSNSRLAC